MDYFASGGSSDGFSLQDMIERDIGNSLNDPSDQQTLRSIELNGFDTNSQNQIQNSEPMSFKIEDESFDTTLDNDQNMSSLNNLSWLCDSNITVDARNLENSSTHRNNVTVENNNPNLLVDPSTGMPIQQQQQQVIQIPLSQPVQIINSDGSRQTVAYTLPSNAGLQQTLLSSTNRRQDATPVLHCNTVNVQHQYPNITQHIAQVSKPSPPITTIAREEKQYPKPVYSYSCLIALALKNSSTGYLPVADIYHFMIFHFPYFKTAPDGWKNSVRHNLSLNKSFAKIENPKNNGNTKKGCLWGLNPIKIDRMDEEIAKWNKKEPLAIKRSMSKPEVFGMLETGKIGLPRKESTSGYRHGSTSSDSGAPSSANTISNPAVNVTVSDDPAMNKLANDLLNGEDLTDLDPALSELAMQSGIWDDLNTDDLDLDGIPISNSPLPNLNISSSSLTGLTFTSPSITFNQTTPQKDTIERVTNIQGSYVCSPAKTESPNLWYSPTRRTVSSQT